jgi:chorismate mutase
VGDGVKLATSQQLARQLAGNWPDLVVAPDTMRNWVEFLRELSEETGRAVVRSALRRLEHVPRIAELKRIHDEVTKDARREADVKALREEIETYLRNRQAWSSEPLSWAQVVDGLVLACDESIEIAGPDVPFWRRRKAMLLEIRDDPPAGPEIPPGHPVDSHDARERAEQARLG